MLRKQISALVLLILSVTPSAQADKTDDFIKTEIKRQNIPDVDVDSIVYGIAALYFSPSTPSQTRQG